MLGKVNIGLNPPTDIQDWNRVFYLLNEKEDDFYISTELFGKEVRLIAEEIKGGDEHEEK